MGCGFLYCGEALFFLPMPPREAGVNGIALPSLDPRHGGSIGTINSYLGQGWSESGPRLGLD
jgi:hypothetical protein